MVTAFVVALAVSHLPAAGVHLQGDPSLHSARLVAQAPPPLPVRPPDAPVGAQEAQLQRDIDSINERLRGLKTDWPTASVVMAYIGWSASPVALVGLLLLAVGGLAGFPALTLVGVVLLVIGLAAVALGIAGIVTGIAGQNAAKAERDELIQERVRLENELKALRARPGSVDRSFESSPRLFTVASF